jgi:hypothetical protein
LVLAVRVCKIEFAHFEAVLGRLRGKTRRGVVLVIEGLRKCLTKVLALPETFFLIVRDDLAARVVLWNRCGFQSLGNDVHVLLGHAGLLGNCVRLERHVAVVSVVFVESQLVRMIQLVGKLGSLPHSLVNKEVGRASEQVLPGIAVLGLNLRHPLPGLYSLLEHLLGIENWNRGFEGPVPAVRCIAEQLVVRSDRAEVSEVALLERLYIEGRMESFTCLRAVLPTLLQRTLDTRLLVG